MNNKHCATDGSEGLCTLDSFTRKIYNIKPQNKHKWKIWARLILAKRYTSICISDNVPYVLLYSVDSWQHPEHSTKARTSCKMYELYQNKRYTIVNGSLPIPTTYNSTLKKPLMPPRMETRSKNSVGLMGTICDWLSVSQYVYKFSQDLYSVSLGTPFPSQYRNWSIILWNIWGEWVIRPRNFL